MRQPDGRNRSLREGGGVEHREVAASLGGAPNGGEQPSIPFGRFLAARHEHRFGERVAGRQSEAAARVLRQVEPDEAVQAGAGMAASGDGAEPAST